MRYGRLHISGFNTGIVPTAVNYAGFHPLAMMADTKGNYGYRMELITYPGSGIDTVKDIRGKRLILTAPSSNSGSKVPLYLLRKQFHLQVPEDYTVRYSGSHAKSIRGVADRHYAVAAVASSVKERMIARGEIPEGSLKVLYRSQPFPTTAYGYIYNLKPSLVRKIEKAFFTFPWYNEDGTPTSLKKEFHRHDHFIPVDYRNMWRDVRAIGKDSHTSSSVK
jgi:phosphonate transport system substrate-binding protein